MPADTISNHKLREKDFRLGQIHGRLQAENPFSEANIQRTVFLTQRAIIHRKRDVKTLIRILGYEVPLNKGVSRGECVDLMGYDKEHNLYIIELKKAGSSERLPEIIEQLNRYEKAVKSIIDFIEKEFEAEYFFPVRFNKTIKKMILAPRTFYDNRECLDSSVDHGYFFDKEIHDRDPGGIINIHLKKTKKCKLPYIAVQEKSVEVVLR